MNETSYRFFPPDLNFDTGNALILTGDPRSGSTWFSNLILSLPGTTLLWEPLTVTKVKAFEELGFSWRQYIPETADWPEARQVFELLLSGKLLNPHICLKTDRRTLKSANSLFIKFCRANQLLPWLTNSLKLEKPPIHLIRHPCAVVASQMRQGGWDRVEPRFEIPDCPYPEFYLEHEAFLTGIRTVEQRLAAY